MTDNGTGYTDGPKNIKGGPDKERGPDNSKEPEAQEAAPSEFSQELFRVLERLVKAPDAGGENKLADLYQAMSMVREAEEKKAQEKEEDQIHSRFIRDCLQANELGDGILYKTLNQGQFVFNAAMDTWLKWTNAHWEVDWRGSALTAVEKVVEVYIAEAIRISAEIKNLDDSDGRIKLLKETRKQLNGRVFGLRSRKRANACLEYAHTCEGGLKIHGREIDQKPWLLPVKNGVVNLKTGELEKGRQKDYLLKASNIEWQGLDAPCPIWKKTLLEIMSGDETMVRFLQRGFGMSLIGAVLQAVIFVLTGAGRNGKSMISNIISTILGPMAGPVRSEMLLDQMRTASSAGPTPDIMALRGLRVAIASETDKGCKVSPSRVKWLTGNDKLAGRNPHDKYEIHFNPTHTLFLLTNHTPHAPADDFAFWERVILIPFELSYVDREPKEENERRADPDLPDKLVAEYPGILAWLVRGCLYYQEQGLRIPAKVKSATEGYRRDEDSLADFIDECCYVDLETPAVCGAAELYTAFEVWWGRNISKRVPKQKWFGKMMSLKFEREKQGTVNYIGIGLLEEPNE